jgi:hypothetical protein
MLHGCVAAVLVSWSVVSCSGSPPPPAEPPPPSAVSAPAPAEAPQCVDAKDQRVQCLSDADCCSRFVCGKDPELSQSVNYCVFSG